MSTYLVSSISAFENKTNVTYVTDDCHAPKCNSFVVSTGLTPSSGQTIVEFWHNKLGHRNSNVFFRVLKFLNINVYNLDLQRFYDACRLSKSHRLPYVKSTHVYHNPLEMVCADVWGPMPFPSTQGHHYYFSFIDSYSRYF